MKISFDPDFANFGSWFWGTDETPVAELLEKIAATVAVTLVDDLRGAQDPPQIEFVDEHLRLPKNPGAIEICLGTEYWLQIHLDLKEVAAAAIDWFADHTIPSDFKPSHGECLLEFASEMERCAALIRSAIHGRDIE
jgi:hypothetical protein